MREHISHANVTTDHANDMSAFAEYLANDRVIRSLADYGTICTRDACDMKTSQRTRIQRLEDRETRKCARRCASERTFERVPFT